jgi:aldehyde:ferredoxin oxidoreductase
MTHEPQFGYHGRLLSVDLDSGQVCWLALSEWDLRAFLGGSGLGTLLLFRFGGARYEPFSDGAPLVFAFSPLVGTPLTTSAKFAVVSRSPLTGYINDALAGSAFALAGKRCGCDALIITGRAPRPSILVVDDRHVGLEPADKLWGTACDEAERQLRARFGSGFQFAVIGPGGETSVRYATISHDGRHAGRGGSGAVMGRKHLKAIAMRGTQRTKWADTDRLVQIAQELSEASFGPATAKYRELGTAANLLAFNRLQVLPTRNFQQGQWSEAERIAPETLAASRGRARASCTCCTIGCEHLYDVKREGRAEGVRVEYESLFALGSLCGVSDPDLVLAAIGKCDRLGLDTISAGGTIAFAMECAERGLWDTGPLRFGNGEAVLRTLDDIAARRGLGAPLAEGSRRLALAIGQGSLQFAPQVKGLELPGYDPRSLQLTALGFAVNPRGADHNRSGAYEVDFSERIDRRKVVPEDAYLAVETEDKAALFDSLILCKFLRGVLTDMYPQAAQMLQAVTGWDVTADELRKAARRIVAAKKQFNILAGWQREEDTLPMRFLRPTDERQQPNTLDQARFASLVSAYYNARGWDADGRIPDDLLAELGLAEFQGPHFPSDPDAPQSPPRSFNRCPSCLS